MSDELRVPLRIILISGVLILLIYGLWFEHHDVIPLSGGDAVRVSGPAYVEGSTWEEFALHGNQLVVPTAPNGSPAKRLQDVRRLMVRPRGAWPTQPG